MTGAKTRPRHRLPPVLALPAIFWFVLFLVAPLFIIAATSFLARGPYGQIVYHWSGANYLRSMDWLYVRVYLNSLSLALLTTFSCLLIGYPMAYVMATLRSRFKAILLILVVIPFWTNFVVRAYALKLFLGEHGPLNWLLLYLGLLQEPFVFSNTNFAVWVGMVSNYLPFMVLPLYVSLEKFDFSLLEASRDLGATSFQTLTRILLPLTRPGIVTGCIFVFAPALGEFVIPDLLGGAKTMLIGNLVTEQFLKTRDWPFGAALSMILIATVAICLVLYLKFANTRTQSEGRI